MSASEREPGRTASQTGRKAAKPKKPKLPDEAKERLLRALRVGAEQADAIAHAGLDERTFERAIKADPALAEQVEKAKATTSLIAKAVIRREVGLDWRASRWYLELQQQNEELERLNTLTRDAA